MKPRAFSYVRFSSPEQAKGDSLRRQMRLAVEYADRHGLELDNNLTFQDLGRSAYHGANVTDGRLGDFKQAVENGRVPVGSYLLVENLDRVSRQSARRAVRALEDICELGITVVTLSDGKAYTAASLDGFDFLFSVLMFMRSHEESETKAKRLKAAWQGKRERIADKPLTAKCPAWLRLVGNSFEVIPERAAIVQRIFDDFLHGKGKAAIAEELNRDKVSVFGRGSAWHKSYISKMLASDTVIGTLTPHIMEQHGAKKKRVPVDSIKGYYPPVIPAKLFDRVQSILAVSGEGRKTSTEVQNILAYVAKCPACGASMIRVAKGKWVYLACSNAKNGLGCEYRAIPYQRLEDVFLNVLHDSLFNFPGGNEQATDVARRLQEERQKLADLKAKHAAIMREIEAVEESDGISPGSLAMRLIEREREIRAVERGISRLVAEHKETSPDAVDVLRKEFVAEMHYETPNKERLNLLVRGLFSRVELYKEDSRNIRFVAVYKPGPVIDCRYDDNAYTWRYLPE